MFIINKKNILYPYFIACILIFGLWAGINSIQVPEFKAYREYYKAMLENDTQKKLLRIKTSIEALDDESLFYYASSVVHHKNGEHDLALDEIVQAIYMDPSIVMYHKQKIMIFKSLKSEADVLEVHHSLKGKNFNFFKLKNINAWMFNHFSNEEIKKGFFIKWLVIFFSGAFGFIFVQFLMIHFYESRVLRFFVYGNLNVFIVSIMIILFLFSLNIYFILISFLFYMLIFFYVLSEMFIDIKKIFIKEKRIKHRFCKKCNTENTSEHLKCWKCGHVF